MARRTFDVVDVTDYAAPELMRRTPTQPGGAYWPAAVFGGEHAA